MDLNLTAQLVISGITQGATFAVLGLGTSLILNVANRFHFAYAATITGSAFAAAVLQRDTGLPAVVCLVIAIAAAAVFGALTEVVVYRPLATRSGANATLPIFVSSLGVTLAVEAALQYYFTRESPTVPFNLVGDSVIALPFGLHTTRLDVITLTVCGAIAAGAVVLLRYSRVGRIVRAVRENPMMASAVGVRPQRVNVSILFWASACAGLIGCLTAAKYSAAAGMGYGSLFSAFVVAFVSGQRAPGLRVVLVGVAVGLVQSLSVLFIPANLTDLVVFGILFVYLSVKGLSAYGIRLPARHPVRLTAGRA
ncbi:branched-chain amino acid ABC transporter permease [Nocardioides pelophilus]|uniref:branched-chain amino acid ABC transporter permease n=1 Tax=Nocardioides pelophilus TaxID=2172019 RepID=UPI0016045AE1|nr:branched-chain amino acid ABC transporter permease [Nocardioides pelophilus]